MSIRLLYVCVAFAGLASAQTQVQPLVELDGETSEPSLSPDGKTLAFAWCKPHYVSCGTYTRQLAGGDAHLFAGGDSARGTPSHPRWSPDGVKIAFTRVYSHFENYLFVRDFIAGAERNLGLICGFLVAGAYTEDPPQTFSCSLRP